MSLRLIVCAILLSVALVRAYSPCRQRSFPDFRADDNDCRAFHVCSFGRLISLSCAPGSVFDDRSRSCVPALSSHDRCSSRIAATQRCPPGALGPVPHPTRCAQYYECGEEQSDNRRGWEARQRECRYPFVFSPTEKKCVLFSSGVCGASRQEPLDQCDYQENQCQGHAHCVPCHLRFPTCRGRQDGLNAWSGRQGSPYYVTCHQQRVVSSARCESEEGVAIFDEARRECVMKTEEELRLPNFIHRPVHIPQSSGNQNQNSFLNTGIIPSYMAQAPIRNQNGLNHNHFRPQPQRHVPYV